MDLSPVVAFLLSTVLTIVTPPKRGREFVRIPNGALEGFTLTSRNGRTYKAFTGIPYGRPPVGPLRFKDPLPAEPWDGVLLAKENVRCVDYQALQPWWTLRIADGREDCLALNVYTHDTDPPKKKPVLFYIHGGAFEFRIGPMIYFNPTYFMDYDMVVVTINYRVGALGFLSFEDDVVPGNMGLKDQNLALRWVYDHIAYFGGDPDRITLMGESAGSVSCHFHAIMPKSRNMVSKVILQSGSAYSPWALSAPGTARSTALKMAQLAGCTRPTTELMLQCLQEVDPYEISKMADAFRTWWDRDPLVLFNPVIEKPGPDAFIAEFPSDWSPLKVPTLMGVDEEDGLLRSIYFKQRNYDFTYVNENMAALLPRSLFYDNVNATSNPALSTEKIINYYFGGKTRVTAQDEPTFSQMYSDILFRWPLYLAMERAVNEKYTTYLYVNSFRTENVYVVKNRVFHVQELFFLWEPEVMPNSLTGKDLEFSKLIVDWWANFVISGNPNKPGESVWEPWKRRKTTLDYLQMLSNGSKMVTGFYEESIRFLSDESGILDRFRRPFKQHNGQLPIQGSST